MTSKESFVNPSSSSGKNFKSSDGKIQIIFSSKSPKYSVSNTPILIPTKLKRFGLSQVINHLLDLGNPVPFDFIINGKILTCSIESYLDSNSISTENVLNVEFIELSLPPKESSTLIHDDWISCVEICKESPFILTGSFDGLLRIWNEQGSIIESSVIENSIRAATWVGSDRIIVGDAKSDISIYQLTRDGCLEEKFKCLGHQGAITKLSISKDSNTFVSGSWDKTIKLWSLGEEDLESKSEVKKSTKKQKTTQTMFKNQILSLDGHSGTVSCVLFDPSSNNHIFSGSWDHSVRLWDIEQERNLSTLNSEKVVTCLDYSEEFQSLITGHEDGILRLWDPRATDGIIVKQKLAVHKNWISSIAQNPAQKYQIATSSYDGTVKVCDIRSTVPLYTLKATDDASKVFAIDWQNNMLVSGGEDSKLHIYT